MKNFSILTLIQAVMSLISAILISKMSFIGKIGVSTFYSQYAVFKTWWKTAILLFIVQFILLLFLQTFRSRVSSGFARALAVLLAVIGAVGFYLSYVDFTTTSHKMMKFSFHFGFYLFWIAWLITCGYFLLAKEAKQTPPPPRRSVIANCEVQTSHPKAVPIGVGTPKRNNTSAIKNG